MRRGLPLLSGMSPQAPPRFALRGSPELGQATDPLAERGALVQVVVSIPAEMANKGGQAPQPQELTALIDTGASIAAIDAGIAAQLGLPQTGSGEVAGVTGSTTQAIYAARIEAGGMTLDPWRLLGSPLASQGFQVLLGRDFLAETSLVYDGRSGTFSLGGGGGAPLGFKIVGALLGAGGLGLSAAFLTGLLKARRRR